MRSLFGGARVRTLINFGHGSKCFYNGLFTIIPFHPIPSHFPMFSTSKMRCQNLALKNSVGLQVTGLESQVPWAGPLSRPGNWLHLWFQTGQTGQLGSHQLKIRKSSEVSSLDCQKVPQLSWSLRCPRCPVSRPAFFFREIMKLLLDESSFFSYFFLGSVPVKSSTVNISKSCQLQFFLAKSCWIPIFWLELPWNAPRLKRQLFSRTWEERSFSRISWQDDIWSYWKMAQSK